MKTIRTYQNVGEAGFAQSLLESAGIEATLDHEAAGSLISTGIMPVRLQVAEEEFAQAEQILAAHPVHFVKLEECPRLGFWKGGAIGLATGAAMSFLVAAGGGEFRVTCVGVFLIFVSSGLVGANLPDFRCFKKGDE